MNQPIPSQLPEPSGETDQEERSHNPYIVAAILALSIVVLLFYRLSGSQVVPGDAVANSTAVTRRVNPSYIVVDVGGEVLRPSVYRLRVGSRVFDAIASAGGLTDKADKRRVNMAARLRDEMKLFVPAVGEVDPSGSASPEPMVPEQPPEDVPAQPYEEPVPESSEDQPAPQAKNTPAAAILPPPAPLETARPVDPSPAPEAPPPVLAPAAKVSINRASAEELEELPGVGPKLANDIVNYRKGPPPRAFTSLEELTQVPGIKQATFEKLQPYIKL